MVAVVDSCPPNLQKYWNHDFIFFERVAYPGTVRLGKTKLGTLRRFVRIKIKGQALKTFRYAIKLIELYGVAKSFEKKFCF